MNRTKSILGLLNHLKSWKFKEIWKPILFQIRTFVRKDMVGLVVSQDEESVGHDLWGCPFLNSNGEARLLKKKYPYGKVESKNERFDNGIQDGKVGI